MSAKTHPRLVGAFVLGAIALVLVAIVFLSSGGWFQDRNRFVVFFPGSVKGLQRGSEVTFRGVRVGEVIEVSAFQTGIPDDPIQIEVVCELYGDVVKTPEGVEDVYEDLNQEEAVALLIEQGVRARMVSASLLTGQKYIELDFMPDAPARLAGLSRRYPEVPTTPTALERVGERMEDLMNKIAEVPLDQVVENVQKAIQAARELLESEEIRGTIEDVHRGVQGLEPTLEETRKTLGAARETIESLGKETEGLGDDVSQTLAELRQRLERTEQTFTALEATLRGADDARVDVSETLVELEQALKAFRHLAEYIQTHPEAILQGKEKEAK
jgi:paraquat-inducible protein B